MRRGGATMKVVVEVKNARTINTSSYSDDKVRNCDRWRLSGADGEVEKHMHTQHLVVVVVTMEFTATSDDEDWAETTEVEEHT